METIEAKTTTTTTATTETLAEVSFSAQPTDVSQETPKPTSETNGGDLVEVSGAGNEVLNGDMENGGSGGDGIAAVSITKTVVVEETEVSVVKTIEEDRGQMGMEIEKNLDNGGGMSGFGGGEDTGDRVVYSVSGAGEKERSAVQEDQKVDDETGGCGGGEEAKEGFEYSVSGGKIMTGNGVEEKGEKGVCSHLVEDSSEDMKVKCSGNGISLVVDVKGSLAGENGSEVKLPEDDIRSLADGNGGNVSGELMEVDVCLSESKMKKQDNGAEIFASEEMKKQDYGAEIFVSEDISKQVEEGNLGEKSNEMDIDLSKGEMESAGYSEKTTEIDKLDNQIGKQENGGCHQKTEIEESDKKMGKQDNVGNSGGKLAEIEGESDDHFDGEDDESDEDHDFVVGDLVWGKIKSHPWWPGQIYDPSDASDFAAKVKHKGRLLVAYFGDGSFSWCSASQLKPFADNFEEMSKQSNSKNFVKAVQKALDEVSRLVGEELGCACRTVEEQIENARAMNSGIKAGVPVPKGNTIKRLISQMEPPELISNMDFAATSLSAANALELTVMKSWLTSFYRKRGGYSLAVFHEPRGIEGLEDDKSSAIVSNSDVNGPSEDLEKCGENADDKFYNQRKQKMVAELMGEEMGDGEQQTGKKSRISKEGVSSKKSSSVIKRSRKREEVGSASPETDKENEGVETEQKKSYESRQRKKSKYLSPPYTSPGWGGKGSRSTKESDGEFEKVPEIAAMEIDDSSPHGNRSSGKKVQSRKRLQQRPDSKEQEKIIDATVNVTEVLHELSCTALDPSYLRDRKNHLKITGFVSSFRSSIFGDGTNYESYHTEMHDRKKKRRKDKETLATEEPPVTLVIAFPPAVSLPTKSNLLKTYQKFGDLIEEDTNMLYNCCCAHVVFAKSSSAKEAFAMSVEKKPFGGGNVRYQLRYGSAASETVATGVEESSEETEADEVASELAVIKQKLEMMSSMVKNCEQGKVTAAEMKASLKVGMKELLKKVSRMG